MPSSKPETVAYPHTISLKGCLRVLNLSGSFKTSVSLNDLQLRVTEEGRFDPDSIAEAEEELRRQLIATTMKRKYMNHIPKSGRIAFSRLFLNTTKLSNVRRPEGAEDHVFWTPGYNEVEYRVDAPRWKTQNDLKGRAALLLHGFITEENELTPHARIGVGGGMCFYSQNSGYRLGHHHHELQVLLRKQYKPDAEYAIVRRMGKKKEIVKLTRHLPRQNEVAENEFVVKISCSVTTPLEVFDPDED